ncbi:hypothetical protein Tco_1053149 [Tanacetum coccineum]
MAGGSCDDDDDGVVGDEGVVVRGMGWWHRDGGKYGVGCRGCGSEDGDVAVVVMVAGACVGALRALRKSTHPVMVIFLLPLKVEVEADCGFLTCSSSLLSSVVVENNTSPIKTISSSVKRSSSSDDITITSATYKYIPTLSTMHCA